MTSRELTSGFDFWSRGHLRMALMHLPVKFGADIFIQCGVIDILPKLKMAAATILDLLGEPWDQPRRHTRGAYSLLKCRHDWIISFQVIRIWNFCRSDLKVLFTPPKFEFFGEFYSQNLGAHHSNPQKAHPCVISRVVSCRAQKSISRSDLYASLRKKGINK